MLFEEAINRWTLQISTFLDYKNLVPQFKNNEIYENLMKKKFIRNESDAFVGYLILFWSLLFLIYKKLFNKLLRRKCFPLIQRNRIINTVWDYIFSIITLNYLLYIFFHSLKNSTLPNINKLIAFFYKSFYIHQAGVNIFIFGSWLKGCSTLFFAFLVFHPYSERLDLAVFLLLLLKVVDATILSTCRFLLCFWNKQIHLIIVKILFICHCLTWSYIYIYFVPKSILWGSNNKNPTERLQIWMWFISECLNSVWLKLFEGFDVYFFPPLSKESIDFLNRIKEQKALLRKQPNVQSRKKAELLKTVTCIMSVKKKLKRMRKAKEAKLGIQSYNEDEKDDVDEKTTKKDEIMQSLLCAMAVRKEIQKIRRVKQNNLDSKESDSENNKIDKKTDEDIFDDEEAINKSHETSV
ncbi:uncharacterized protein LOC127284169 isoform X1 [Leptopilina boulardi]|uniref:uncharacterized protein LOC127284169 isoform X1 n=2 Tax=Leptopilina boulardi TaxID=63433 RepID=UPI0021F50506|nr:uncharacterized protein LOC127284169 isoform X1 [Leptopilina boulardi]